MANFFRSEPKNKHKHHGGNIPRDGLTGMSADTELHFVNVARKINRYVGERSGEEFGEFDLEPPPRRGNFLRRLFADGDKAPQPNPHSRSSTPQQPPPHRGFATPPSSRKQAVHPGFATPPSSRKQVTPHGFATPPSARKQVAPHGFATPPSSRKQAVPHAFATPPGNRRGRPLSSPFNFT